MAYERMFSRVFLSIGLFLLSLISAPIHSVAEAARSYNHLMRWPEIKVDVTISLALDRIARYFASLELGERMRRFRAFVSRAVLHDAFDGDGFRQPV